MQMNISNLQGIVHTMVKLVKLIIKVQLIIHFVLKWVAMMSFFVYLHHLDL